MISKLRMIVLTKSYKDHAYCVAGLNCNDFKWIRLVTDDENFCGAIEKRDIRHINPLDVIELFVKDYPKINYRFQKENLLIDENYDIKKVKTSSLKDVINIHPPENHEFLFGNNSGAIHEENDILDDVHSSLMFIKVENLKLSENNKASFIYNEQNFSHFSLTDPDYYHNQEIAIGSAYLVISFPEIPFDYGNYYKFIAKIFLK